MLGTVKDALIKGCYSCVIASGSGIKYALHGMGVKPLMIVVNSDSETLLGATVADKVIGRAAAVIMVLFGVKEVYGHTMSVSGRDYLTKHGIICSYGELVSFIYNRTMTGGCPLEASVADIEDPAEAMTALRAFIARMMAAKS